MLFVQNQSREQFSYEANNWFLITRVECKLVLLETSCSCFCNLLFPGPGPESPALENLPEKEDAAGLREVGDTIECHLADMLQQLTAVNSAKPSERTAVRQGESGDNLIGTDLFG